MTTLRQAAQQALAALELAYDYTGQDTESGRELCHEARIAANALRAALAEPVAKYSDIVSDGGLDPRNKFDAAPPQRKPLTIDEVEQILAQHSYELHGDRARYIFRMTEEAHGIKEGA